jgi:hypothetical protein
MSANHDDADDKKPWPAASLQTPIHRGAQNDAENMIEDFRAWLAASGAVYSAANTCDREGLTALLNRHGLPLVESTYQLEAFFGGISCGIDMCVFYTLQNFDYDDCLGTGEAEQITGSWPHRFLGQDRLTPFGISETRVYYATSWGQILYEDWYLGILSSVEAEHPVSRLARNLMGRKPLLHRRACSSEFQRGRRRPA